MYTSIVGDTEARVKRVREPSPLFPIDGLDFDDANIEHMSAHELTPDIVLEVLWDAPVFVENAPGRTAAVLMTGRALSSTLWTIALVLVDDNAWIWRPITGWNSTKSERQTWFERS